MERSGSSRRLWEVFEPLHAVVYFAPEVLDRYRAAGLRGFWMGYFAGRALPLAGAPTEVVTAALFGFAPPMVARALPDAWTFAAAGEVAAARQDGVGEALRRLLGADAEGAVEEAGALVEQAARCCAIDGRALYAAHLHLDWPDDPWLRLWHAATLLREHRGDGHVAANVAAGVSGLAANVMLVAEGRIERDGLQPHRGWTDEEWSACVADLEARRWLAEGRLTGAGAEVRRWVEERTDALADEPWSEVGDAVSAQVLELLRPLALRIIEAGGIPMPNPMGVPRPGPVVPGR